MKQMTETNFGAAGSYYPSATGGNISTFFNAGSSYIRYTNLTLGVSTLTNIRGFSTFHPPRQLVILTSSIINSLNQIPYSFYTNFPGYKSIYVGNNLLKPIKAGGGYPGIFYHNQTSPTYIKNGNNVTYLSTSSSTTRTSLYFSTYISYAARQRSSNVSGNQPGLNYSAALETEVTYSRNVVTQPFSRYSRQTFDIYLE